MLDSQCAETMSLNSNRVILCYWFFVSAAAALSCLCCHVDIRHLVYLYCGVMLSLVRPFVQFCLICVLPLISLCDAWHCKPNLSDEKLGKVIRKLQITKYSCAELHHYP